DAQARHRLLHPAPSIAELSDLQVLREAREEPRGARGARFGASTDRHEGRVRGVALARRGGALMDPVREVERWIDIGRMALRRGDAAGAVEPLRRALTLDPDHGNAHALLAEALCRLKRIGAAHVEADLAIGAD